MLLLGMQAPVKFALLVQPAGSLPSITHEQSNGIFILLCSVQRHGLRCMTKRLVEGVMSDSSNAGLLTAGCEAPQASNLCH
jgi:hypothetical protein